MTLERHFPPDDSPADMAKRRAWLAILARAETAELESAMSLLPMTPAYTVLRPAEVGAVMVRARAGGTGRRFNLGEATVTRCTVRLADGTAGVSYALGRDTRRAELAAVLDAVLQDRTFGLELHERAVAPLAARQAAARDRASREAAATKVDFFTLARGDG